MFVPISISDINPYHESKSIPVRIPWELSLFYQITANDDNFDSQKILIDDLIDAYETFMVSKSLVPLERELMIHQLRQIRVRNGTSLVDNGMISYYAFRQSLNWMTDINRHYSNEHINILSPPSCFNWYRNNVLIITGILEIIMICLIVLPKISIGIWLLISRVSAIMILSNMAWLLVSLLPFSNIIPDNLLIKGYPVEHSTFYHKVFGVKILLASVSHIIGHALQVVYVLQKCVEGCSRESVHIVHESDDPVMISYSYFASQYPYYTGIILACICFLLASSILLTRSGMVRYSNNTLIHKYCGILIMIMVIAHGGQGLLGFNYSYVFVLPLFVFYLWDHRYELYPITIDINRWFITPTMIRLYLRDSDRFSKMLDRFENVSISVKYPEVSKLEWHTFTLSRNYESKDLILSMKRVGRWTNALADNLQCNVEPFDYLQVGHCAQSNFRFHRQYNIRYFFCAGIGITAFMASIADMIRNPIFTRIKSVLVWSVNDVSLITQFGDHIMSMQKKISDIHVFVYYSNRSSSNENVCHESKVKFSYLQSVIYANYKVDIVSGNVSPMCCRFGRADFINILSREASTIPKTIRPKTAGVFICGSKTYANHALDCIDKVNRGQSNIQFKAWPEIAN